MSFYFKSETVADAEVQAMAFGLIVADEMEVQGETLEVDFEVNSVEARGGGREEEGRRGEGGTPPKTLRRRRSV